MKIYTTTGGEMLDQICFSYYGDNAYSTEVMRKNPHLADLPFELPAGIKVYLPEVTEKPQKAASLW